MGLWGESDRILGNRYLILEGGMDLGGNVGLKVGIERLIVKSFFFRVCVFLRLVFIFFGIVL